MPHLHKLTTTRSVKKLPKSCTFAWIFSTGWLLVILSMFAYGILQRHDDNDAPRLSLQGKSPLTPCRRQYFTDDQCSFVREHCTSINEEGLFQYLPLYYCSPLTTRWGILVGLILWLIVVFAGMATAADMFLAINLASLVHSLRISENLAGVTIFAFGNGSSDFFSTLVAMDGGNGSLAISELFGAAAFIVSVVLGAIAVIRPFQVKRKFFLGDVLCFIIAASVNLILISDGSLALWESLVIIGLYVMFVAYVLLRDRGGSGKDDDLLKQDVSPLRNHMDNIPNEATVVLSETTPLIVSFSEINEGEPTHDSLTTPHGEAINGTDVSDHESSTRGESNTTGMVDWASEIEHEADVPPFIRLCQILSSPRSHSLKDLFSTIPRLPALVLVGLTTVMQSKTEYTHEIPSETAQDSRAELQLSSKDRAPARHYAELWLICLQIFTGPQFLVWLVWSDTRTLWIVSVVVFTCSVISLLLARSALLHPGPRLHFALSAFGFLTATAWIYIWASEAVALIEAFGVISDLSDALLGATVFAIGNSSNDIFADISVAKRGHPVLASAACLGGPMLNTLLGIGFGSLIQVIRGGNQPYVFSIAPSLFVSAASLLTALAIIMGYVLLRDGRLDKYLGYGLMTTWVAYTVVNVYVSMKSS